MFLVYRNQGERRFGLEPIAPYPRGVWEFQFVTQGPCSLLLREGAALREERLRGPVLVVTGPECVHGWGGLPSDVSGAIIFHFDEVCFSLRSLVGQAGCRLLPFSPEEIPFLQQLYERCAEARRTAGTSPPEVKKRAGFFEPTLYGIIGLELTLFFLKHLPRLELGRPPHFGMMKVAEAVAWYEANLARNPPIGAVAKAVHLSATHLRRLFDQVRGRSPQAVFRQIRFERVKWLMRDPALTLERIAEGAGFGSASAFSRAFKAEFGIPPRVYRETLE